MKVLVTGGAGFIGRHVCRELRNGGHQVAVIDALRSEVHRGGVFPADLDGCELFRGDLANDRPMLEQAMASCDAIIHLAAAVSVADSAKWPVQYIHANTTATASLCEVLSRNPVQRLVVASSMSVYGEGPAGEPTRESWRICPASVYGMTKYDQERLCQIVGGQAGVPTMALRLFNVYGPGQATHNVLTGVIANWAAAVLRGERPHVCEDGQQTRDFVFVTDVARAFRLAVESDVVGVVNIGSGIATTVYQAARSVAEALGRPDLTPVITHERRKGDVRHCYASNDLARELLGWSPQISLADGLNALAERLRGAGIS